MLHQPSGVFEGQATGIMTHAQERLNLKKRINEIYVQHPGQPPNKIEDAATMGARIWLFMGESGSVLI